MLKTDNLPESPGVYLFKSKSKKILYVGKAINLRKRVKSYFTARGSQQRTDNLLKHIDQVSFEKVSTELEALLLEARLIKQYQPKYNARLKDDTRYLYLGITREEIPRVFLLRQPEKTPQLSSWYGPFPSSLATREVYRLMRRVFPFRSCRKLPKKTCLYYQLKICGGYCQFLQKRVEYRSSFKEIRLFLGGRVSFLKKNLQQKMAQLAKECKFEEAAKIKNQIQALETIFRKFKKVPEEEDISRELTGLRKILIKYQGVEPFVIHRLEVYDIANLGKDLRVGAMAVLIRGEPQPSEYRHFKIKTEARGDPGAIREVLERRFAHQEWLYPQLILIDGGKPQLSAAFSVLRARNLVNQIALVGLVKEKEETLLPVIDKNAIKGWKRIAFSSKIPGLRTLQLARDEAHRFAQKYFHLRQRKLIFPSAPKQKSRGRRNG